MLENSEANRVKTDAAYFRGKVITELENIKEGDKQARLDRKNIFDKLDKLPCGTHAEKFKSVNKHFALLWSFVGIIASIFGAVIWIVK